MPPPVLMNMRTPEGAIVSVPAEQMREKIIAGYVPESADELVDRLSREQRAEDASGPLGALGAASFGLLRGSTLGLSDVVVDAFADDDTMRDIASLREERPWISGAAEIVGMVAPAIASGGTSLGAQGALGAGKVAGKSALARAAGYLPAGAVARLGAGIAERGAAKGLAGKITGTVVAGAVEGGIGNAGMYLSDVALGNRDLSAEGFVGAMGQGAMFGGAAGGAVLGIEGGLIGTRKLFAKVSGGTAKAAQAAEGAAARAVGSGVEGAEATAVKVKDLVRAEKLKQAQAKTAGVTAREESRTAAQIAKDEASVAKAQAKPAGRAPAATKVTDDMIVSETSVQPPWSPESTWTPAGPQVPVPGARPTAWTDEALNDSGQLAEMLGQAPTGTAANLRRAEAAAVEAEAAAAGVRDLMERTKTPSIDPRGWAKQVRGNIAQRSGGKFAAETRAATAGERAAPRFTHGYRTKLPGQAFDAAGEIVEAAAVGDDVLAFRGLADPDLRSQYDDMITQAAIEPDQAIRNQLLNDAADFEAEAFESAVRTEADVAGNQGIMAARERSGLDNVAVAARRADERSSTLGRLTESQATDVVTGVRRPYEPKPLGPRQVDEAAAMRSLTGAPDPHGAPNPNLDKFAPLTDLARNPAVPFTDEAYESIQVIDRLERANAELVEAATKAGVDVHPAAQEMADGYAKALGEQERKVVERTTQHADDIAEATSTPGLTPEVGAPKKRGGKALDALTALETLDMMGQDLRGVPVLGGILPAIHGLPVVGPLLGMWLKFRAVKRLLHGGGPAGKVAATGESKAAAWAARTRDRATAAVDKLLEVGAKGAKKAQRAGLAMAAPHAAEILRHQLFDDGVDRSPTKDEVELALARIDEISMAQANPGMVRAAARRALGDATDPDLVRAVEKTLARKLSHLASVMPKSPPPSFLGRGPWRPSRSQIASFARSVMAAEDPASVFEALAAGHVSTEAAESLRKIYPQIYAEAANRLMDRAAELTEQLPYQRVLGMGVLFDVPLVPNMVPERILALQNADQALGGMLGDSPPAPGGGSVAQQPMPTVARPPDLDSLYTNPADRRASRRA